MFHATHNKEWTRTYDGGSQHLREPTYTDPYQSQNTSEISQHTQMLAQGLELQLWLENIGAHGDCRDAKVQFSLVLQVFL